MLAQILHDLVVTIGEAAVYQHEEITPLLQQMGVAALDWQQAFAERKQRRIRWHLHGPSVV